MPTYNLRQTIGPRILQQLGPHVVLATLNLCRGAQRQLRNLPDDAEITLEEAIVVWLLSHITERGIISISAMQTILQVYKDEISETALIYAGCLEAGDQLPPRLISIADRRIVRVTCADEVLDIINLQFMSTTVPTFEGVSYNLARPVWREWSRLQAELKHGTASEDKSDPAES